MQAHDGEALGEFVDQHRKKKERPCRMSDTASFVFYSNITVFDTDIIPVLIRRSRDAFRSRRP